MKTAPVLNIRWLAPLVVAVALVIVGFSGLAIFRWYIARVDASLPPLPVQNLKMEASSLPNERARSEFPPAPGAAEKARVFGENFQLIHQISALPEAAKTLFTIRNDKRFAMADPGKPWQVGCVGDGSLPRERLIFGGVSKDFAFVHYEFGGIGHGYRVEVYRVLTSGWQPAWIQYVPRAASDMEQLRQLVTMPEDSCCTPHKRTVDGQPKRK